MLVGHQQIRGWQIESEPSGSPNRYNSTYWMATWANSANDISDCQGIDPQGVAKKQRSADQRDIGAAQRQCGPPVAGSEFRTDQATFVNPMSGRVNIVTAISLAATEDA